MPPTDKLPCSGELASALRDWQRVLAQYASPPTYAPRERAASPAPVARPGSPAPAQPVAASPIAALREQLEAARDLRLAWEQQARALRDAGASRATRADAQRQALSALGREAALSGHLASVAGASGRAGIAADAQRAANGLGLRAWGLERQIREAPLRDARDRARGWDEQLAARIALLEALRAPEADILRLTEQRVAALQQEAQALRGLGLLPEADRAQARALRLGDPGTGRSPVADPLDRRIREVLGSEPRNADRVTPLAVARAEREAGAARIGLREESAGLERRVVVELRAPRDLGHAAVDALVNEVIARVVDALRSRR